MSSHFITHNLSEFQVCARSNSLIPHLPNALCVSAAMVEIVIGHYLMPEAAHGGLVSPFHHTLINTLGALISFSFLCFHQAKYLFYCFLLFLDLLAPIAAKEHPISLWLPARAGSSVQISFLTQPGQPSFSATANPKLDSLPSLSPVLSLDDPALLH